MKFLELSERVFYAPQAYLMWEDWYEFVRYPCKVGFIDVRKCDGNREPFNIDFNDPSHIWFFYRLNGQESWDIEWCFDSAIMDDLWRATRNKYTSEEIYAKHLMQHTITPLPDVIDLTGVSDEKILEAFLKMSPKDEFEII